MNKKYLTEGWSDRRKQDVFDALAPEMMEKLEAELGKEPEVVPIPHVSEFEEEAAELVKTAGKIRGYATGLHKFDRLLMGMEPGDLIVISGATGEGKSMLALNMAVGAIMSPQNAEFLAKQKRPHISTLIFSLEMTQAQATARLTQIVNDSSAKDTLNAMPIFFYGSNEAPSLAILDQAMATCRAEHGLDLVIIDHLHYFSRSQDNETAEIGHLVREIKRLAKVYGVPILLLAHTRKMPAGAKRGAPSMDDLRSSSFIAQDADQVIIVRRDIMDPVMSRFLTCYIAKNRNKGGTGKMVLNIRPMSYRLDENTDVPGASHA